MCAVHCYGGDALGGLGDLHRIGLLVEAGVGAHIADCRKSNGPQYTSRDEIDLHAEV